ncbi:MAG: hypothetical protein WA775_02160 [Psychroserpens sp.]|uniref:hypothetical protein n=1 Tax=Psychroserpens sp. TaxID=2020870 RepID=UPI003C75E16D
MPSKRKKVGFVFVSVFVLALVLWFVAKQVALNQIEKLVENLPQHIELNYTDLGLDIVYGNLEIVNPKFTLRGKTTNNMVSDIEMKSFRIAGFGYWDYFVNDNISVESVVFDVPIIAYYHNDKVNAESYDANLKTVFNKNLHLDLLHVGNASVHVFDSKTDSLIFSAEELELKLNDVTSKTETTNRLPVAFSDFLIIAQNIKYNSGNFENLSVDSIEVAKHESVISGLSLKTKNSKTELSHLIETERDHINLSVASIEVLNQELLLKSNSSTTFMTDKVKITEPVLKVYRDKLVRDDLSFKPLYSKMLRELNLSINLNSVIITKGDIVYEENVKTDRRAGKLEFLNVEATIDNLSNMYAPSGRTSIKVSADFMRSTPLNVDWSFDVNDVNDRFIFKADMGLLKANELNQFMQPNLNLKLEGELIKTYFTIDGNANDSHIDLKTDYDEFDIILLKENGKEKNKFLSGIINLIIAKDSKNTSDDYRYSKTQKVERDKTKSVFNFVYKNVQAGLLSAMTGSGKKSK